MLHVYYRNGPDRCARCGEELLRVILAPDPEVRERNHWHWLTPLCRQCTTPEEGAYAGATMDCPACGMPMHYSPHDKAKTPWFACSSRCYQRVRRRAQKVLKTSRCAVCKTVFYPPRSDALYCSYACRQWQYRRRLGSRPRLPAPGTAGEGC